MTRLLPALLVLICAAPAWAQPGAAAAAAPEGEAISLAQALKVTDERNINLQAARIELEKVQADLYWAWSTLLPTARGTLTFTHNDHAIVLTLKQSYWDQIKSDIRKIIEKEGLHTPGYWEAVRTLGLQYWLQWSRHELFDLH